MGGVVGPGGGLQVEGVAAVSGEVVGEVGVGSADLLLVELLLGSEAVRLLLLHGL